MRGAGENKNDNLIGFYIIFFFNFFYIKSLLDNSRISISGINTKNIDYIV
jgi:hypothetical protein